MVLAWPLCKHSHQLVQALGCEFLARTLLTEPGSYRLNLSIPDTIKRDCKVSLQNGVIEGFYYLYVETDLLLGLSSEGGL